MVVSVATVIFNRFSVTSYDHGTNGIIEVTVDYLGRACADPPLGITMWNVWGKTVELIFIGNPWPIYFGFLSTDIMEASIPCLL